MTRARAADDFATIRARLDELRREREEAQVAESELQRDLPPRSRSVHLVPSEVSARPGRVRPSGPGSHLSSVWDL
jgi:hypothetical protein